jgi:hypothetical protein
LAIKPGELIRLPAGTRLSLTCSIGLKLAAETTVFAWPTIPLASGESLDISRMADQSACYAVKLFAENVAHGATEIVNRKQTEVLRLSLEASHPSHIGLWLNYGAWSGANTAPYYNAGIEPTTFPHDDLSVAARHDTMAQLGPGATCQWEFSVSFRRRGSPIISPSRS